MMRGRAVAAQPGRLDKPGVAPDICLGARQPGVDRQVDDRRRVDDVGDAVAERRDDPHCQHEQRKCHDRIDGPADDAVEPAAVVTGRQSEHAADSESERNRHAGDAEIEPGRNNETAQDVAPELVGAEPVDGRRALQCVCGIARQRIIGRDPRTERRHCQKQKEHAERHGRHWVLTENIAGVAQQPPHASTRMRGSSRP